MASFPPVTLTVTLAENRLFHLSMYLTRDGTAKRVSRDQILRRERGQGNIIFPCSADHEQDWQPYPVFHSLAIRVTTPTYLAPSDTIISKQNRYSIDLSVACFTRG